MSLRGRENNGPPKKSMSQSPQPVNRLPYLERETIVMIQYLEVGSLFWTIILVLCKREVEESEERQEM